MPLPQPFTEIIQQYDWATVRSQIYAKTPEDVQRALNTRTPSICDFMALISPAAQTPQYIETMARLSRAATLERFGRTIQFYVPLYLTNSCINHCVYCGFNHSNKIHRIILTGEQILEEVRAIKAMGDFRHILLVTGENPKAAGVDYIARAIDLVKPYFSSISIEVQPLSEEDYRTLISRGLNAVYCYQETYNAANYPVYHPRGLKADFAHRLDTFDRLGRAGIHKMGLGVLIGLEDWRTEAVMMALHLRYLQKRYWQTRYSVSFPRIRPHEGPHDSNAFRPNVVMSEGELAQLIFAFRLFDHNVEIAMSTRERAEFRDNMASLGVTSLSAGSKTDPGGYAVYRNELEQFAVNDARTPDEVLQAVRARGYEVVWKDWDAALQR